MSASQQVMAALERCRSGHAANPNPPLAQRKEWLSALSAMTLANRQRIRDALQADYGQHPEVLSDVVECGAVVARCRQAIENLDVWAARDERPLDPASFETGSAWMEFQPKGVVGNMVPWNFPFELGLSPLAEMLGAGNRVVVKPSELAPACAQLLAEMLAETFDPDLVTAVTGGADVAEAFAGAPWDHLMFTGGTEIGRRVMALAAPNLTPLTLELGGKCPVVVGSGGIEDGRLIESIIGLKLAKAGQICVTVDHVLVPRDQMEQLVGMLQEHCARTTPNFSRGLSVTGLISDKHVDRIGAMLDDARKRGARIVELEEGGVEDRKRRTMPLRLVVDPPLDSRVATEEIFGPILPIIPYDDFERAIAQINAGGSPLGIYLFSQDQSEIDQLVARTRSGGVTINGAALHCCSPNLGFGGIGASGFGRHHGIEGFQEFSNKRAMFVRGPVDAADFIFPPYGPDKAAAADMIFG